MTGQVVTVVYVVNVSVDSLAEEPVPRNEEMELVLGALVVRPVDCIVTEEVLEVELVGEGQAAAVPTRTAISGRRAEYIMKLPVNESEELKG